MLQPSSDRSELNCRFPSETTSISTPTRRSISKTDANDADASRDPRRPRAQVGRNVSCKIQIDMTTAPEALFGRGHGLSTSYNRGTSAVDSAGESLRTVRVRRHSPGL